jgi:hypothetical protein
LAATIGWPVAIYFDTHGSDEFIAAEPGFWAGYQQQSRPVTAQQTRRKVCDSERTGLQATLRHHVPPSPSSSAASSDTVMLEDVDVLIPW